MRLGCQFFGLLVAAWPVCTAAAQGQTPCHYTMTEIPNPPGWITRPAGINNLGHVAGFLVGAGDFYRAFFWSPGTGTVILPLPPGHNDMGCAGLNDFDQIVGYAATPQGVRSGYIYDFHASVFTLIAPPSWAHWVEPAAINNTGMVAGTVSDTVTGPVHAFRWHAGVMTDLGTDPAFSRTSQATDINESGLVVGHADTFPINYRHAFRFDESVAWLPEPPEIPRGSFANGISDSGFVAGRGAYPGAHGDGLIWLPWGTIRVEAPESATFPIAVFSDINSSGRAVGTMYFSSGIFAVAWQGGVTVPLQDLIFPQPTGRVDATKGINESGQIAATISNRGAVLTPRWLAGDLTGDCHVSIDDLLLVLSNFGRPRGTYPLGDVDLNGEVGLPDLAIILAQWGG
ncbi:MAG: hypothetical protein AMXMBFR47_21170 [Planctomycetota bacterium]